MKTINNRTVKLTPTEQRASVLFECRLDSGDGIYQAIDRVRAVYNLTDLSDDFYAWLAFPSTRTFIVDGVEFYDCDRPGCPCNEAEPPVSDLITACACGHLSTDHVRVEHSMFVCSACACDDHVATSDPILLATCITL